eukprot:UC4_evm1s701
MLRLQKRRRRESNATDSHRYHGQSPTIQDLGDNKDSNEVTSDAGHLDCHPYVGKDDSNTRKMLEEAIFGSSTTFAENKNDDASSNDVVEISEFQEDYS